MLKNTYRKHGIRLIRVGLENEAQIGNNYLVPIN